MNIKDDECKMASAMIGTDNVIKKVGTVLRFPVSEGLMRISAP